jgi:kynurenine formamidase
MSAVGGPRGSEAMTNWHRWGRDDELGAANLLTPELVLSTLRTAATTGRIYSLAQPIQPGAPGSAHGHALHLLEQDAGDYATGNAQRGGDGVAVATDHLSIRVHGTTTHIDSLGHVWSGDSLYNGHPSSGAGSRGLAQCGIDKLPGIVTRGLMLDLPAHLGVQHLEAGHEIRVAELEACLGAQGLEVRAGDAVLLRTGFGQVFEHDPHLYEWEFPGLGLEAARWLSAHDTVLVGADTLGVEVRTREAPFDLPVHLHLIHEKGIYLAELLRLDELAADRVGEFLFVVAPLRLAGGTGSPVNPLAIA